MKELFIHDEIILSLKIKKVFAFFCSLGILGTLSLLIPAIQRRFFSFAEKMLINHSNALSNWVPIFIISSLTCFFIIFILTVIKKTINKYEFFIFIFFIIQLLSVFSFDMSDYIQQFYLLSFRYGFAHTMLIGTIVDMLSYGGYVSRLLIFCFVFCNTIWLSFLVSTIIGHLVMKADDKISFLLLTVLYLSSSISIQNYFYYGNYGRMEIYVLLFVLIILSIVNKKFLRWFIPVLCCMCLATHQVVVFFYIPFIFIILLYGYLNKQNQSKNEIILLIISTLFIIVSFIYFVVFSKTHLIYQDMIVFADVLKNKTNIQISHDSLQYYYFLPIINKFRHAMSYYKNEIVFRFYCILQNLPLFLFFILFWRTCIRLEQKKTIKFIFLLSMLIPIFSIPAFIFFIDWGRWVIMLLTVQFMLVYYFLHKRDGSVILTMKKFIVITKKHSFIFLIYIMLSIFFGPISFIGASPNFHRLMRIIMRIIQGIL